MLRIMQKHYPYPNGNSIFNTLMKINYITALYFTLVKSILIASDAAISAF